MFSGIIADVGRIVCAEPTEGGLRLTLEAPALDFSDVQLGDSIACNGVCLTVIAHGRQQFTVDVSRESLSCTVGLDQVGGAVNLEKALRLADRLGGHLVTGHVDGVGEVLRFDAVGDNCLLEIRAPQSLARYIARKGSVAVDGVSLTVNRVEGPDFSINLIPHTLQATNLHRLAAGARVNLEIDLVARYVERMLTGEND